MEWVRIKEKCRQKMVHFYWEKPKLKKWGTGCYRVFPCWGQIFRMLAAVGQRSLVLSDMGWDKVKGEFDIFGKLLIEVVTVLCSKRGV